MSDGSLIISIASIADCCQDGASPVWVRRCVRCCDKAAGDQVPYRERQMGALRFTIKLAVGPGQTAAVRTMLASGGDAPPTAYLPL
jgi:hypothetical protein